MTPITRRSFAAGTAAMALLPATPAFARSASRSFRILRGTEPIGTHAVSVRHGAGGGATSTTTVDIAVKRLGFTVYRYTLSATETFDASGTLVSVEGQCDDDGDPAFVSVTRQGDALAVAGSSYRGAAPLDAATPSYWRSEALRRTPWISTQSGELLAVSAAPVASAEAPAGATAYRVTDGAEYTTDIFYDARGEWVGSAFDARGERATIVMVSETGPLA